MAEGKTLGRRNAVSLGIFLQTFRKTVKRSNWRVKEFKKKLKKKFPPLTDWLLKMTATGSLETSKTAQRHGQHPGITEPSAYEDFYLPWKGGKRNKHLSMQTRWDFQQAATVLTDVSEIQEMPDIIGVTGRSAWTQTIIISIPVPCIFWGARWRSG